MRLAAGGGADGRSDWLKRTSSQRWKKPHSVVSVRKYNATTKYNSNTRNWVAQIPS